MHKNLYILAVVLVIMASCSGEKHNFRIKCDVTSGNEQTLYLSRLTLTGMVAVDSALPDRSGSYTLNGYTDIADFFILYFDENQYINLILRPGDDVTVKTDASTFDQQYFIEGSMDSRLVQKLVARQALTLRQITEISTEYESSRGSVDFERIKARIDSTYEMLVEEHRSFSLDLIRENPSSLAGLMALYQQLGRNTAVFDENVDMAVYEMVDSNLAPLYPTSEAVKDLNRKVAEIHESMLLGVGSVAPEISLADSTGNQIALSSLRGKYVLLCFWASWSPQSLEQIKAIASIYPEYGQRDLECYLVSLDRTRLSWVEGIKTQAPAGIHVSDLMYWNSPVVETYRITEIPRLYLLDREGRILATGFEAGELSGIFEEIYEKGN